MKNTASFQDVENVFDDNAYYTFNEDEWWYRYMWSVLEKHNLTQYENDIEYYTVLFRAVALLYMFFCYASESDGVYVCPDAVYENSLYDEIPEFVLGQLYAKEKSHIETEPSYAVFILAQKEYNKVINAILSEMTPLQLLHSLCGITYREEREVQLEDGEYDFEDWSPESYEDYLDLIINREDDIDMECGWNSVGTYECVVENKLYFDSYQ